jgi:uncharacterized membrane protein
VVTTYTVLKTIQVLAIVTWVGGGSVLTMLVARARRATDHGRLATLVREIGFVGPRVFAPSSGIVVITGIWLVQNAGIPWDFWIVAGLVGWAATFITGNFILRPQTEKIDTALTEKGPSDPETLALIGTLLNVARVDQLVLALVVIDMVIKPT